MHSHVVLVDRDVFYKELRLVFDNRTTETLLEVLDKVAQNVIAASVQREDFTELKAIVAELAERQLKSEERMQQFHEEMQRLQQELRDIVVALQTLKGHVDKVEVKLANIDGRTLELIYHQKASAYFGRLLRRPKVFPSDKLWEVAEAHVTEEEFNDLLLLDLLVKGKAKHEPELGDVWLAVEISAVVDEHDVQRAARRAALLRKAGNIVIPVVAGEDVRLEAEAAARQEVVVVMQDGRTFLWEEAFAKWKEKDVA